MQSVHQNRKLYSHRFIRLLIKLSSTSRQKEESYPLGLDKVRMPTANELFCLSLLETSTLSSSDRHATRVRSDAVGSRFYASALRPLVMCFLI